MKREKNKKIFRRGGLVPPTQKTVPSPQFHSGFSLAARQRGFVLSLFWDIRTLTHTHTHTFSFLHRDRGKGIHETRMAAHAKAQTATTTTTGSVVTLDHVVILVPYSYLSGLPGLPGSEPSGGGGDGGGGEGAQALPWFRELFTFSPGGRHADGVTENVLVLFRDGVYLEFIAFTPESAGGSDAGEGKTSGGRDGHKWGKFVEGSVVDWAVTVFHGGAGGGGGGGGEGGAQRDYDDLVKPITDKILKSHDGEEGQGGKQQDGAVVYGALTSGGRTRPDGVVLEWATVPAVQVRHSASSAGGGGGSGGHRTEEQIRPGLAPFWCLDETPRERRVPYLQSATETADRGPGKKNAATEHGNSGAVGVAGVKVTSVPGGVSVDALGRLFGEVFGAGETGEDGGVGGKKKGWPLRAPEGTKYHPDGRLEIVGASEKKKGDDGVADGGEEGVVVSLYTDRPELVGKKIGGQVDGKRGIWFELVGV